MDDPLKIKRPYENFKVKPGGLKKRREERNRPLMWAVGYLIKNLNKKGNSFLVAKNNYRSTQICIVKVSFDKNGHEGQWAAHGRYLERKGAQRENEKGLSFNETDDDISIVKTVKVWQEAGDKHLFKIILSPEKAADIDLKEHVRQLMKRIEKDLGTKLQWIAIEHYNTLHFHVHLDIRGIRDYGQELRLNKEYIKTSFRERSQQILTEKLGIRMGQDVLESRNKIIKARHITDMDREINFKLTKDHCINLDWCTKNGYLYKKNFQIKQRLEYLETLGLAKGLTSASWYVSPTFLDHLKFVQEQDDIIKMQRKHSEQIVNKDLPVIVNKLSNLGDTIIGRVSGTGLSDRDENTRYILIEGIDGQIHHVKANSKIMRMKDNYQLATGNIVHLERVKFVKDSKEISYIDVHVFQDWDVLRMTTEITSIDRYIINRIVNNGYIPEVAATANAVRVQFMKIIQGRVDYFKRVNILNDRLEVNRDRLDIEMNFRRRRG